MNWKDLLLHLFMLILGVYLKEYFKPFNQAVKKALKFTYHHLLLPAFFGYLWISAYLIRVAMILASVGLFYYCILDHKPDYFTATIPLLPGVWGYLFSDLLISDLKKSKFSPL